MPEKDELVDVVVIGSGVAGALIAWKIALAGARVVILEAGERGEDRAGLVERYVHAQLKTPHSPYVSSPNDAFAASPDSATDYYDQQDTDLNNQYKSTYERRVGGSTWHWLGHTPRLLPSDFRLQSIYGVGVDWPISYCDLEPWYCEAERALGVAGDDAEWRDVKAAFRSKPFPMQKVWQSYADRVVTDAMRGVTFRGQEFRILSTPSARNTEPYDGRPVCCGNSTCVPLCPIGAKYDASVHVNKAIQACAELRERCVVTKLEIGPDGLISGVVYRRWEANPAGIGGEQTIRAKLVVLAANAIESAKILLLSAQPGWTDGAANKSGQVGRNLMDHLQKLLLRLAPQPLFPFRGPPTTSGIEAMRDGPFRSQHAAFRLSLGNDGWSRKDSPYEDVRRLVGKNLFGAELRERLADRVRRQYRMSCSAEVLPSEANRVTLSDLRDQAGIPRPKLVFTPGEYTTRAFPVAVEAMSVVTDAIKAVKDDAVPDEPMPVYSGAGHVMGTCRMGGDAEHSVVNSLCRAHDHPNLYIVGASTFPTCGTANPTLTIAALALRSAEAIQRRLAEQNG